MSWIPTLAHASDVLPSVPGLHPRPCLDEFALKATGARGPVGVVGSSRECSGTAGLTGFAGVVLGATARGGGGRSRYLRQTLFLAADDPPVAGAGVVVTPLLGGLSRRH